MKIFLIVIAIILVIGVVGIFLYLQYLAKNSPSITGNEYDKGMKQKIEQQK